MFDANKILTQPWGYYISRNLPVWHDSLMIDYSGQGYKSFGLPHSIVLRVHRRGVESDFYHLLKGRHSKMTYVAALQENFSHQHFVDFIKKKFKTDCAELVRLAGRAGDDFISLRRFFVFYGLSESMLDLTAYGSKILTDKILELLRDNPDRAEIMAYYTRPAGPAPIQELERELDKLYGKKIDLPKEATRLYKKYHWIPVSFSGEPWSVADLEKKIKEHKISPAQKLIKPKVKIPAETMYYLRALSEVAYLNEFRKAAYSRACLSVRPALNQLARKHGFSGWKDFNYLSHDEILDLAKGKNKYQKALIAKRQDVCIIFSKTISKYFISEDKNLIKQFENKFKPKSEGLKEISGVVAHRGIVRGVAKVVSGPADFSKFKTGDILIAKMTSVDFLPIMKRAAAFVTDEGGLACHAAIISREYNKPCIVGTALATSIFKDGDLVEVDAERGVVKIIK